jgi:hypothetical protein
MMTMMMMMMMMVIQFLFICVITNQNQLPSECEHIKLIKYTNKMKKKGNL